MIGMLVLTRSVTQGLLQLEDCVVAVEDAFSLHGSGQSLTAKRYHVTAGTGGFHVTSGGLPTLLSVKVNGHFPPNKPGQPRRLSGAILLSDGSTGEPIALIDSLVVTLMRTAAVTAVAVRHLAVADARTALIVGAGRQVRGQIDALRFALSLERLTIFDRHRERSAAAAEYARSVGVDARSTEDVSAASRESSVIVTVTPARTPVLSAGDVSPGTLVVAIGADGPGKQELDPRILAGARVVVDVLEQAATAGELARAIEQGVLTTSDVYAELGEIVAGRKRGRSAPDETFVFDSTGTGFQDAAAAAIVLEAARRLGLGMEVELAS